MSQSHILHCVCVFYDILACHISYRCILLYKVLDGIALYCFICFATYIIASNHISYNIIEYRHYFVSHHTILRCLIILHWITLSHILLCPIVLHPRIIRHHGVGSYHRISSRSSWSVLPRCFIAGWMSSDRLIRETKSRMNSLWIVDERAAAPGQSQAGAASDRTSLFQKSSWIPPTTLTLPNQCKANTY